ncbi:hypothetical protein EC968_002559 [Mortierella alpina]|nr:hypothetical protein EC968_002559 [Mortierella alpina]
MEHHARHVWRRWCEGGRFGDGHLVTLDKIIEFIGTEVLPKEEDILRQRMERTIAPVSGIESRILPVLQLWKKQELQNHDKRHAPHHSQFEPLANISPPQELHVPAPQLGSDPKPMPGAPVALPTNEPLSALSAKSRTNTIPTTIILDSEDEKEGGGEQEHLAPSSDHGNESTSTDLELLRLSLTKAQEISKMVASLCADLKTKDSESSEQFPTSIFLRLHSAQQKARDMGLETIMCEPLLLKVLEEHMRVVHDLNAKVARNDIVIVSKDPGAAAAAYVAEGTQDTSRMNAASLNMPFQAKDDPAPLKAGDQDDMTVDKETMDWEADAGSNEAVTSPKFLSTAKSVLDALEDGPDDVPEMDLFSKVSEEKGKTEDSKESTFKYEMIRGDRSIRQIWEQWTVGVNGNPAIQSLEEQYGTRWRLAKDTNYLNQSRCIVREVARLITDEGHTEEQAIQLLQDQLGSRAIGSLAIQLFKENAHRTKSRPKGPRLTTSGLLREKGLTSSPLPETPLPPKSPRLPRTSRPKAPSVQKTPPPSEVQTQTPAEIWDELVRNSRLMDVKFFTPSSSTTKRHKSTALRTLTRMKEAPETSTSSQATSAADADSANNPPTTTVAATIPTSATSKASGKDSTQSPVTTSLKDPTTQIPTSTSMLASSSASGESPSAQSVQGQPPTPTASSVAPRTYKTAVEEAHRDVSAIRSSALVQTSPVMDPPSLPTRGSGMAQTKGSNTATSPATTQILKTTPTATVQAPSQTPTTQVVHPTHPKTRAGSQAQAGIPRPLPTTTTSTEKPSNNALALVYANALLTRFMATSLTQDADPSSKGATGDRPTTKAATETAAAAAMTLVSLINPTTSLGSAPTTSTLAPVLTLAPLLAAASAPVPPATHSAPVPPPASTGAAAPAALTVRTRSSSRKASSGTPVQTLEPYSSGSKSLVSTPTTSVTSAASTPPPTAPTTAPITAPTTAPTTASTTALVTASTTALVTASTTTLTTGPTARLISGGTAVQTSSQVPYRMKKDNKTVFDVWTEWMEGSNGRPSIANLNRQYGDLSWLAAEERALYRDQRMVLVEVEKLVRQRGMQVMQALGELEQKRVSLNVDIKVFGKALAENRTA